MISIVRSGVAVLILVVVQLFSALPISRQVSSGPVNPNLLRLAAAIQRDASRLVLTDSADFTLLDGTALTRIKATDKKTGEIVGGTMLGDKLVDEQALREAASTAWRAQHGAITPELLKVLQTLKPDDTLQVSVWLVAQIEELKRPDVVRAPSASGTTSDVTSPATDAESAPASNVPTDQVPEAVKQLLSQPLSGADNVPLTTGEKAAPTSAPAVPDTRAALAQAETLKQQNTKHLQAQVKPVVDHFAVLMQARGVKMLGGDNIAPTAMLELTRAQAEEITMLPEIDAMYAIPANAGPDMGIARPTQNADLLETLGGYTGAGVKVAVAEGERMFFANPWLTPFATYDGAQPYANHPTAVGGMIRSTHPTVRGIAPAVDLYSANGSYSDWNVMKAALNYATVNADVINNSWYWDGTNSAVFWEADRILDFYVRYNFDFVAVAAGNFGNGCGGNFSSYVVSPAKGYNVMSVGNYDDHNTLTWTDDSMDSCSSFGNPGSDSASPTHAKPEVAAVGHGISSTLTNISDPLIGDVGSGTSYASPMIAGLAANMIQADSALASWPEGIKAVIMATALHNIEGNADYSDKDGAGGMDATAAMASVERANWVGRTVATGDTYPIQYYQYAHKGERVRFVITWDSNPNGAYTTDVLPADLDLVAYRANGTTVMDSSASSNNNFEIVDFIAPATETYNFSVSKFSFVGSATYMGVGWWRGVYRISPDVGYTDPKATPLGTHLANYPNDWTNPTHFWRAVAVRPVSSDHDLELRTASLFDSPVNRSFVRGSYYGGTEVDMIMVDGNHWPAANQEQYLVDLFSGTGGYDVNLSHPGTHVSSGWYGPYALSAATVVRVFDLDMPAHVSKRVYIVPDLNNNDLVAALYTSSPGDSSTWTRARSGNYRYSDRSAATDAIEYFDAVNTTAALDYMGLAVWGKNSVTSRFWVYIEQTVVALPMVRKP